ncbi:MAG: EscS/YscS/HrcS family type III secretion system export apparatus protein [Rhodomicrobiaceae bacterium]
MYNDALLTKVNSALLTVLFVSSPILLAAVTVGILVGLLQALTQIHDQTLPQAVKLIVTLLIIVLLGPLFTQSIVDQASTALDEFPLLTR